MLKYRIIGVNVSVIETKTALAGNRCLFHPLLRRCPEAVALEYRSFRCRICIHLQDRVLIRAMIVVIGERSLR